MEDIIARINELYNKGKVESLTPEELAEQKELRAQYLKIFRSNFRNQLEHTHIKELDGTVTSVKSKRVKRDEQ